MRTVIQQTQSQEARSKYDTEVNNYLKDLLGEYNHRDTAKIQKHLDTITKALDRDIEGAVKMTFGGSISKYTYVNGLSDVDMLVMLNDTSLAGKSPEQVKEYFAERLKVRFPDSDVRVGKLAVTVKFASSGVEVQLLPALSTKTGVKIATVSGKAWSKVIRPDKFAEKLTQVNRDLNGRVVPVVKLFKGLNSTLRKDVRLKGYHIESLAIDAFSQYRGPTTYKDMLQHLCRYAADAVLTRIIETTGQSRYVDEYLGANNSPARQMRSATLQRTANRISRADTTLISDEWKDIMEK